MKLTSIPRALPRYVSFEKKLMEVEMYRHMAMTISQNMYFSQRRLRCRRKVSGGTPRSAMMNTKYFITYSIRRATCR